MIIGILVTMGMCAFAEQKAQKNDVMKNALDNMMKQLKMNQKDRLLDRYSKSGQFDLCYLSTEVKENTDFLLTPALLVQEALNDSVIPTYPRE